MTSETLRVGFDVSPLVQTRAGTARYLTSLLAALEVEGGVEIRRLSWGGAGKVETLARDVGWYPAGIGRAARQRRVDLLHCPTFRAPLSSSTPLVVTFHDLAVLRHPATFNWWTRELSAWTLPRVAHAADAIVAVSEFTRNELGELLGVGGAKVTVIGHGVAPVFASAGPRASGDYVLAVSTLEPRKNLQRLLEGFRRARLDGAELRVAGARGWGGVRLHGDRVRWLGEVGDVELARLYRGALCVAYPSLYEGFGLPVLEAMACGAPVVTSTAPALREVGADAVVAVDAVDADAIAAGLEEAAGRRVELGRLGVERAARYSWSEAARRTLDVYRSVARS